MLVAPMIRVISPRGCVTRRGNLVQRPRTYINRVAFGPRSVHGLHLTGNDSRVSSPWYSRRVILSTSVNLRETEIRFIPDLSSDSFAGLVNMASVYIMWEDLHSLL